VDAEVQPHEKVYMERRTKGEQDADAVLKLLGPRDATPNPFTISESSKREQLHLRM
jgi:hypothetical protein